MSISKELITKAQAARSVDDLIELAKSEGIDLNKETAQTYFDFLKGNHELSESELDAIAGGKGDSVETNDVTYINYEYNTSTEIFPSNNP